MQTGAIKNDYMSEMLDTAFIDTRHGLSELMRQMFDQGLEDGELSLKIKVQFEETEIDDPTQINLANKRQITSPKLDYKVIHAITLKDERKGTVDGSGYEVVLDSHGNPTIQKVKTAQTTIFDEDSASNWGVDATAADTNSDAPSLRVLRPDDVGDEHEDAPDEEPEDIVDKDPDEQPDDGYDDEGYVEDGFDVDPAFDEPEDEDFAQDFVPDMPDDEPDDIADAELDDDEGE